MNRGRILGVDLGSKRIGLAISDPDQVIALPLEVLAVEGERTLDRLAALASEREVVEIVVGLPKSLNGREGPSAVRARRFADELETIMHKEQPSSDVVVRLYDERLTTAEANKSLRGAGVSTRKARRVIDAAAAATLLQDYIDHKRSRPE